MILDKRRRHFERYIEIGRILAKYGWGDLISRLGLADIFRLHKRGKALPPGPEQLREALEELGPTFIKLGQLLSTRPDIIPQEYAHELEKLQDEVSPFPFEEARDIIEEEFGQPLENFYLSFDPTPLAAASLGQVHEAILADGTDVVVKVQRPGIRQTIDTDLEIISGAVRLIEQHFEKMRIYALSDLVDEFSITIHQELDYTREGRNSDQFRRNFANVKYAYFAKTMWDYTTVRVLTQEHIKGIKITNIHELDSLGYDRLQIARNLSRIFFKMMLIDGFFHADPHPGNIVVLEGNVIGLLDYGMVGHLDQNLKTYVTMLMSEYLQEDSDGYAETLLAMGSAPSDISRKAFTEEIDRLLRQYYGAPTREIRIGEILRRALRISAKHKVRLPASLGLLIKVIIVIEGIDQQLCPEFDFSDAAKPFINESVYEELSFRRLKNQAYHSLIYWKRLLLELPHRTSDVLDRMSEGAFRIVFHHEGLEGPVRDIDKSANRLSFALVNSATIVASAVLLSAEAGPMWHGYSILGLIGFGVAFLSAVWLMISIIRAGKLW